MGGAVSAGEDNDELIDKLVSAEYIKTPSIEWIFRAVDRGFYYLPTHRSSAYSDQAWRCNNLHLSAPCIYSEVMEALQIEPGLSFLNIGSGTGYLSTLVGLMLGKRGINHGIELHAEVVKYAQNKLHEFLTYSPALYRYDFAEPCFVVGNAITVLSEDPIKHQYDRVYCGAAVPTELEYFMKSLLKINGILVMPFSDQLVQVTRKSVSEFETKIVLPVNFASLVTPSNASSTGSRNENKANSGSEEDSCHGKAYHVKLPELQPYSLKVLSRWKILDLVRLAAIDEVIAEKGTTNHFKTQASKRRVMSKTAKIVARKVSQRLSAPIFEESDTSSSTSSSAGFSISSISSDDGISDSDKSCAGNSSNNENPSNNVSVILQSTSSPIEFEVNSSDASQESSSRNASGEAQNTRTNGDASSREPRQSGPLQYDVERERLPEILYIDRLKTIIGSTSYISHALSRFIHSGLEEEPTSSSTSTSSSSSPVTSGPEHLTEYPVSEKSGSGSGSGTTESADSNGDPDKRSSRDSRCSLADSGIASTSSAIETASKRSISVTEEEEETDGKVANSSSNVSELGNNSEEHASIIASRTRAIRAAILNRRRTKLRRVALYNTDSDDSESQELSDSGKSSRERRAQRANDEDDSADSSEEERKRDEGTDLLVKPWVSDIVIPKIKQKIQQLPLPPTLQVYVNFCRPLKP